MDFLESSCSHRSLSSVFYSSINAPFSYTITLLKILYIMEVSTFHRYQLVFEK